MKTYINTNIAVNLSKIMLGSGTEPFYASDYGFFGGEISGLAYHRLIV